MYDPNVDLRYNRLRFSKLDMLLMLLVTKLAYSREIDDRSDDFIHRLRSNLNRKSRSLGFEKCLPLVHLLLHFG